MDSKYFLMVFFEKNIKILRAKKASLFRIKN